MVDTCHLVLLLPAVRLPLDVDDGAGVLRADNGVELIARVLQVYVRHVALCRADDDELGVWRDAQLRLLVALQAVVPVSLYLLLLPDVPDLHCGVGGGRHDHCLVRRHPRAGDGLLMCLSEGEAGDSHTSVEHLDRVLQAGDDTRLVLRQLEAVRLLACVDVVTPLPGGDVPKVDRGVEAAREDLLARHHEVSSCDQAVVRLEVVELLDPGLDAVDGSTAVCVAGEEVLSVFGQCYNAGRLLDLPAPVVVRDFLHIPQLDPVI